MKRVNIFQNLKNITDKAQSGEYTTTKEFTDAMDALNTKYLGKMGTVTATEWQGILNTTQTNIDGIKNSFFYLYC